MTTKFLQQALLRNKKRKQNGFTLIELMVVVAIVGVLSAVGLPQLLAANDKAKDSAAQAEVVNAAKTCSIELISSPADASGADLAIDADDRCNGYQTSSPFRDYSLEHMVSSNNRRESEAQAHKAAAKIAEEQRGEWFKISTEQAKDILNKLSVNLEKAA